MSRNAESGPLVPEGAQSVVVPAILDGDSADVALAADADFITSLATNRGVLASFSGAPQANLGIVGAWISTPATGVVTIRFSALTGNVAGGAQLVRIKAL